MRRAVDARALLLECMGIGGDSAFEFVEQKPLHAALFVLREQRERAGRAGAVAFGTQATRYSSTGIRMQRRAQVVARNLTTPILRAGTVDSRFVSRPGWA
ncbi:hypothetical protein C6Q17_20670 [Burkholderia contaminans]|nr:hypothetical protein C6Q17_20670 [Burkholderia contaminans]